MVLVKQFLTKTRPSQNTSMFRYAPVLPSGELEVYCLISISNSADVETSRFNKFVWDGLLDGFLSKDDTIISRLKNALVASEFKLKELIRHDSVLKEKGVDLNLSVLVFKENKVFVGVLGEHKVFVYKKKMSDISQLLLQNKSNVGSTLISPKDIFVVSYSDKDLKSKMQDLKEVGEIEDFLKTFFEKEDSLGGAFLASLEEEKKVEVKATPVPVPKTEEDLEITEEVVKEDVGEKKDERKEKFKQILLLILAKFKILFNKFVDFLSRNLSKLFEKLKSSLRNRYGRKRWFKKLQSSSSVKKFAHGFKPFKVDGYKDKELRTRRFVVLLVILALIFIVFLGVRSTFESRQRANLTNELNVLMEDWDGDIDRAERRALEDSEESLEILTGVSKELDKYLSELKDLGNFERLGDENNQRIEDLEKRISRAQDKAYRIVPLDEEDGNMELFLDTKLSFGERSDPVNFVISKGSQIVGGEMLYLIDSGEKAVYEILLKDGTFRKVGDSKGLLKNPLHVDLGNNREDEGLYVYDLESGALRAGKDGEGKYNEFQSLSGLTPRALGGDGVSAFAVFGPLDSLNFLVPSESRIVQAVGFGGGTYNLPSEYITHPSFEKGTDLFGDQYIYVLSKTPNGIKRFVPSTGLNSQLMVSGLDRDLNSITTGYTGATMDRVMVVFDSEIQRFVKFSKPIELGENLVHPGEIVLKAQYEYRGKRDDVFKDVKGVVVTDNDKIMYVLDGRKIWKINLEQN